MRVISTWHQPTSVHHSVKLDEQTLAVATVNKVELLSLSRRKASRLSSLEVWGRITSLQTLKRPNGTKALLVTTDHPNPMALILSSHSESPSILTVDSSISLLSRSGRVSEFFQGAIVNQHGALAAISSYVGTLNILQVKNEPEQKPLAFECRIPELAILSLCFLPGQETEKPGLAILYLDNALQRCLVGRDLSLSEKELSAEPSPRLPLSPVQPAASLLVSIPGSTGQSGGILVIGGNKCSFFECLSAVAAGKQSRKDSRAERHGRKPSVNKAGQIGIDLPYEDVAAISVVGTEGSNILISDVAGRLSLLQLQRCGISTSVSEINVIYLGEISPPTTITYLNANVCYVGSHLGESQFVRLPNEPATEGSAVRVIESFGNIAPILDAGVVDLDGVPHVVTCSGGYGSSAVKLIRNGADFEELAVIDNIPGVTSVFPLRNFFWEEHDSYILFSSFRETRLLSVGNGMVIEEPSLDTLPGLARHTPTLAAGNLKEGNALVQVTKEAVIILDLITGMETHRWSSGDEIIVADLNPTQICAGMKDGALVYLFFQEDRGLVVQGRVTFDTQISAISINPLSRKSPHSSNYVAIARWGTNEVSILKLPDLIPLQPHGFAPEPHLPRSILLHSFGSGAPSLLVGLANGWLVAYSLDSRNFSVKDRKTIPLGTKPVRLLPMKHPDNDELVVFATGNHPAILFYANGRLQYSSFVLKHIVTGTAIRVPSSPASLLLASPDSLTFGRIGELKKRHIRSIPFIGENAWRIAHMAHSRVFGIGFTRMLADPKASGIYERCSFKICDETSFQLLDQFEFDALEEITSLAVLSLIRGDQEASYFVLGTMYEEGKVTTEKGRLLVFEEEPDMRRKFRMIASQVVPGCVFALAAVKGVIAAAINSAVTVFSLEAKEDKPLSSYLASRNSWNRGYQIINLTVRDDLVILGDALRSVEVLQWSGHAFTSIAKDNSSLWPLSLETLDDETIMVAETEGNVFTYRVEGGRALERQGRYHLDELVNKFERRCVSSVPPNSAVTPSVMLFTSTGRIAIVSDISDEYSLLLTALQRNLSYVLKGPGNVDHTAWRAVGSIRRHASSQPAVGFLDGDFLERFLDIDPASVEMKKVLEGNNEFERLNMSYEEIVVALEQLQTLH